jgi:carbonic anhydrase/acetyltransferase-like protein (isoleucine patch superfamily)
MAAVLLNGVVVGRGSIVAAGAVVPEGSVIPPDSLVLGVPGVVRRLTRPEERARVARTVANYVALLAEHRRGAFPPYAAAPRPDAL